MRAPYRILAFVSKELQAIFQQPRLIVLLIAGPFLVLLTFGLGYRARGPILRTIVVQAPPDDPAQAIGSHLSAIGPPLQVVAVQADLPPALEQLKARQVDLVVVVPPGIQETLVQGRNARLVFYHNAIDPVRTGYIAAVVDGATNQLNRAFLKQAIGEQQASAADYERTLRQLRDTLAEIRAALQRGDRTRARALGESLRVNSELVASLWLFVGEPFGYDAPPGFQLVERARKIDAELAAPEGESQPLDDELARLEGDVDGMLEALGRAQKIPPDVLVSPLAWETQSVSAYQPGYVAYHSPTVLALLVQHLCVTLAALSLVDERSAGAIELFQAGPTNSPEILLGKFAAYVLVVSVTTVGLVVVLVDALHIPLLGDWRWLALVTVALMGHSLALGFLISALSHSRSQAIQMSMLALLGSIFFSGFFVPLEDFALPVRAISYSLPVTYGIEGLREVILRGQPPQLLYLSASLLWAVFLGALSIRALYLQLTPRK